MKPIYTLPELSRLLAASTTPYFDHQLSLLRTVKAAESDASSIPELDAWVSSLPRLAPPVAASVARRLNPLRHALSAYRPFVDLYAQDNPDEFRGL